MSINVTAAGGNADLAAKCYPSGTKNEAKAMCLCGGVEITLETDSPTLTAFCHCESCRRAHSAPMYQMMFVATANICSKTGAQKEGNFELTITKGFELLTPAAPGPGNPNYESMDDNPNFGGIGRLFCSECGVTMMTVIFARPRTEFNDGDEEADMFCVFPATFTDKMNEFIQSWQPTHHVNCDSAILPLAAINDGLDKWAEWPEGEPWIGYS